MGEGAKGEGRGREEGLNLVNKFYQRNQNK